MYHIPGLLHGQALEFFFNLLETRKTELLAISKVLLSLLFTNICHAFCKATL